MPVHNDDIAKVFEKIAHLLEIRGENPFLVRAYRGRLRPMDRGRARRALSSVR
ncbi:MAG: hypothetical protein GY906_16625 [bacterium]|nr:hypothetical protein [bacterium]